MDKSIDYVKEKYNKINNYFNEYIIYRIIFYIILGFFSNFNNIFSFILQLILFELFISYINKNTDININLLIYIISISLISYITGIIIHKIYYKSVSIKYFINIYIIITVLLTIAFLVARCYYNFNYFDDFLYKKDNENKNMIKYVLFHVIYYMILGYVFSFNKWQENILHIIVVELLIAYVERCNYKNMNWATGIYSITIGLFSYFTGASIKYYKFLNFF